jgi:hypothetical protein
MVRISPPLTVPVAVVGSYMSQTLAKPNQSVDVAVLMPASLFQVPSSGRAPCAMPPPR